MIYADFVLVLEWIKQEHIAVQEGFGSETMVFGNGGAQVVISRVFSDYGRSLEMVPSFKYLEIVISAVKDDWSAVFRSFFLHIISHC